MNALEASLLAASGFVAGVANTLAGGGSLVTLPVLVFMGYPAATVANATTRPALLFQNIAAISSFWRGRAFGDRADARRGALYALLAIPGALAGSMFAVGAVGDQTFKRLLAVVMIVVLVLTFRKRKAGKGQRPLPWPPWATAGLFILVGFYGGFIQAGVGFIIMAAFIHATPWPLLRINAWKVVIVGVYTLATFIPFWPFIAWGPASVMAVTHALGGLAGAKLVQRFSEELLMRVYAALLLVFAASLVFA